MQKDSIVLLSKDILMSQYLPIYGNKYWKTPNIDELAVKGTVFNRHYTAAPSTGMAFTAMMTGKYPYQMEDRSRYTHVEKISDDSYLIEQLEIQGFDCHIVWNDNFLKMALPYSNCFGNATIHTDKLNQFVGPHQENSLDIYRDDSIATETIDKLKVMINKICSTDNKIFLWIHLPHVLYGRTSYGDDIDLFDLIVGFLRTKFSDENLFISADHGNMNGSHGKFGYGFHVYEPVIRIPLIAPRIMNFVTVDFPTSNIQLKDIILKRNLVKLEFVVSDTAYYAQPKRRVALIKDNYKLIFNKQTDDYEFYDIEFDTNENVNLLKQFTFDSDRDVAYQLNQVYFYQFYEKAVQYYNELMSAFKELWKTENAGDKANNYRRMIVKKLLHRKQIKRNLLKTNITNPIFETNEHAYRGGRIAINRRELDTNDA